MARLPFAEDGIEAIDLARFAEKAGAVRDGVLHQARVEAAFLPGLLFLPTLSIGAVVLFGGHDVIGGALTYGEFFLFYQLLLQLVWPLEALGWILSLAQRATASASRSSAVVASEEGAASASSRDDAAATGLATASPSAEPSQTTWPARAASTSSRATSRGSSNSLRRNGIGDVTLHVAGIRQIGGDRLTLGDRRR